MKFESASLRRMGLSIAGEPFVYFDGEQTIELNGVFSNAYQRVEGPRGPAIGSRRSELEIAADDVACPKQGHLLFRGELADFVGEFDYEVASAQPDESEGMFRLVLKVVRS